MPIRAQSADGALHEFPDETQQDVIDRTMKSYAGDLGNRVLASNGSSNVLEQVAAQEKGQYDTQLSPQEESTFQNWKQQYAPNDSGVDYDLRGAFKAGLKPDPQTGHWPDTFKKPNHPTFSNQSMYATQRPDLAGFWQGERFIPPDPFERAAARTRRRYPTREPDPASLAASAALQEQQQPIAASGGEL